MRHRAVVRRGSSAARAAFAAFAAAAPSIAFVVFAVLAGVVLPGCSIKQDVEPIAASGAFTSITVHRARDIHMDSLHGILVDHLEDMGFRVSTDEGEEPRQVGRRMTYTANWRWDVAMYLWYFQAEVWDGRELLGRATYDAKGGGANMGKFGTTEDKIRPLMEDLFAEIRPFPRARVDPIPDSGDDD